MSIGPWQIAIIVLLLLVLFGRGRISEMMGDFGKGIKSFKNAVQEGEDEQKEKDKDPPRRIEDKRIAAEKAARERDRDAS